MKRVRCIGGCGKSFLAPNDRPVVAPAGWVPLVRRRVTKKGEKVSVRFACSRKCERKGQKTWAT